jgi:hypothetical protein
MLQRSQSLRAGLFGEQEIHKKHAYFLVRHRLARVFSFLMLASEQTLIFDLKKL